MTANRVNPNTPEFFDKLYNGVWEVGSFKRDFLYEDEGKKAFYQRLVALPFFNFTGRILDVGCGVGGVLGQLQREEVVKYGIDFSTTAIEKIKLRMPGTFVVGDVHRLPFQAGFFDRVICSETLEHVDDPAVVVADMKRVLRPGGKLLVTVPDHSCDLPPEQWPGGISFHVNTFSLYSLKSLLLQSDLIVESAAINHREIWMTAIRSPFDLG